MEVLLVSGAANHRLAEAIGAELRISPTQVTIERFPDTECHVEVLGTIRGKSVYILQPTSPPVTDHLFELLLLADACWRAGATDITAVVPYFGYARQDRRASGREPVTARIVADLIRVSHVQRLVVVDVHTPAIEGFFGLPVEHLTATPLLAEALRPMLDGDQVLVAPDLGAVKLAERYASLLKLPMALVHKHRLSGAEVRAGQVVGEVQGRAPIIVDDMITTGGTIEAAVNAVLAAGAKPEVLVAATHGLFVGPAPERLRGLPLRRLLVSDSVVIPDGFTGASGIPLQVCSLAPLLADAVRRLHGGRSLSPLLKHE
jgi:ribose-phosphate pyrophosphokinase